MIFDIETNGLEGDKIHCITAINEDTEERLVWTHDWREALPTLANAKLLVGHNILDFDIPFIQRLEPSFKPKGLLRDTLVWARLVWPDVKQKDFEREGYPSKLIGSHSLKAWGVRLGVAKGDFDGPWHTLTDEMLTYAQQDVEVTLALYEMLKSQKFDDRAISLEHRVHRICMRQTQHGFKFDEDSAWLLLDKLSKQRQEIADALQESFPPFEVRTPFVPKANNKRYNYVKGQLTEKVQEITFNPASRHHIANRLKHKYDWRPSSYTEKGQPKVDETVLNALPYREAKKLSRYFLIQKRIAAIGEGRQAWLNNVVDSRIHGRVICNGAVSGRATHIRPNMAQIPSCRVAFGQDCRSLFTVDPGNVLVGSDVSGLELRVLAHYMSPMDNGEYAQAILEGDIHTYNQEAAGLETRDQAKTFIYALIFSAGAEKLGQIAGGGKKLGASLKKKFLNEIPALSILINQVTAKAERNGCLTGLDGRSLRVRSPHSSLNLLIQSAGAVICKQWLVEMHRSVRARNLSDSCKQVVWVHDEVQWECSKDNGKEFGEIAVQSIRQAGDFFGFRMQLDAEFKVGKDWSETH